MEHRWNIRIPFRSQVEIVSSHETTMSLQGKARNISAGGMFVEVGDMPMTINDIAQVSFMLLKGEKAMPCRVPAFVTRISAQGIGLMFIDMSAALFDAVTYLRRHGVTATH